MLTCQACHAGISDSRKTSDINIPEIAFCRQCHKQGGASKLAAEGRCFECHSYHDWRKERRGNGIIGKGRPKASTGDKCGKSNPSVQYPAPHSAGAPETSIWLREREVRWWTT